MNKFGISLLLACLLLLVGQARAQQSVDDFTSLESQGKVPTDFKKMTSSDKDLVDYNVYLKKMVSNGRILFGTKLNDYVNTIVDNLLKNDPVLRSKIHVYISKSPVVNAYATSNGLLIVNLGMIAQVSNESELAFVLGHEIAHYAEKHLDQMSDYMDTLRGKDYLGNYVKYKNRSREHEMAADRIALERYFKNSSYSYEVVDGTFDVLQYSDLPFDEVPFSKSLVETDFYQFPTNYYLANVAPINNRADMVDTLFTHPNIEKRRTAARAILVGKSNEGRSIFVQSEQLFNEVRELARMECINLYLTEHQYDHAFYNAYVMQRVHPNNKFLREALVSSVYGFSKHRNNGLIGDVLENYKNVEGEMQQTSYFLSKLSRPEASALALRMAWKAREADPDNAYYTDIINDAMKDLFVKNKMKYQDFSDYPMGTNPDTITVENNTPTDTVINKYDRIKKQNQPTKVIPTSKFKTVNYMLVDLHQNPDFNAMMNAVINQAEDEKILDVVTKKKPADIKSVVLMQPQYRALDNRNRYLDKASRQGAEHLKKNLSTCMRRLKIDNVSFSTEDICNFTIEQYNGYVKLQQWMCEYLQAEGMEMVYHNSKDMSSVYDLTGTTKVCMMEVKRTPANFVSFAKMENLLLTSLCPYWLPAAVTAFGLPRYSTEMHLLITDFQTGKMELTSHDSQISPMSDAYVNSFMYDKLYDFVKGK